MKKGQQKTQKLAMIHVEGKELEKNKETDAES